MITKEERQKLRELIDPRLDLCYDYLFIISETRMLATHGGNISLVTFDGEILVTKDSIFIPTYPKSCHKDEQDLTVADYEFMDDILIFVEDGKQGIMDYNGEEILEAKYSEITFDEEQNAQIMP